MLDPKKTKAIVLLSTTNMAKQEVASEVGVTPVTLSRWLKEEEFSNALLEAHKEQVNLLMGSAVKRLGAIIKGGNESNAIAGIKLVFQSYGILEDKVKAELSGGLEVSIDYGEDSSTT